MEKILNELNKLNIDYFDGFLRRYNKLKEAQANWKAPNVNPIYKTKE